MVLLPGVILREQVNDYTMKLLLNILWNYTINNMKWALWMNEYTREHMGELYTRRSINILISCTSL